MKSVYFLLFVSMLVEVYTTQAPELPEICTPSSRSASSMQTTHDCLINENVFGVMFHNDTCNYLKSAIACEPETCCNAIKNDYDNDKDGNGEAMRKLCGDGIKINCKKYTSSGATVRFQGSVLLLGFVCFSLTMLQSQFVS